MFLLPCFKSCVWNLNAKLFTLTMTLSFIADPKSCLPGAVVKDGNFAIFEGGVWKFIWQPLVVFRVGPYHMNSSPNPLTGLLAPFLAVNHEIWPAVPLQYHSAFSGFLIWLFLTTQISCCCSCLHSLNFCCTFFTLLSSSVFFAEEHL